MKHRPKTLPRIKQVLIDAVGLSGESANPEDDMLIDRLVGFDSVAAIEFVIGLEREFNIQIEPADLEMALLKDLDRLASYIDERVGK